MNKVRIMPAQSYELTFKNIFTSSNSDLINNLFKFINILSVLPI